MTSKINSSKNPESRQIILAGLVLFLCVFSFYAYCSFDLGFIYDDREQILAESPIINLEEVGNIFTDSHFTNSSYYRPVSRLALKIQLVLFGQKPFYFRLLNSILAAVIALCLYLIFVKEFTNISVWLVSGCILCGLLHPVFSTSVYVITGQEALLALIFALLSMHCFSLRSFFMSGIFLYLSVLSRENAIVLPLLFTIFWFSFSKEQKKSVGLKSIIFFWGIGVLYLIQRMIILSGKSFGEGIQGIGKPILSCFYLIQTFLAPFWDLHYEPPSATWISVEHLALAFIVLGCIVFGLKKSEKNQPLLLKWGLWLVLILIPSANILKQQTAFAERHIIFATPAFVLILLVLADLLNLRKKFAAKTLILSLIFLLGAASCNRASFFKNDFVFARQWIKTNPQSGEAAGILGNLLWEKGNIIQAIKLLELSINLEPGMTSSYDNLGCLYGGLGKHKKALDYFKVALRRFPFKAEYRSNYAYCLLNLGQPLKGFINFSFINGKKSAKIDRLIAVALTASLSTCYFLP